MPLLSSLTVRRLQRFAVLMGRLGLSLLGMPAVLWAQDLGKLTVAYSSRSIAPIDYFIAEQNGFFKAEGLDVRLVQIRANVAVMAALASEVDVLGSITTAISAAQRGAPIKVLAVTLHRPLFWLVARPEFKNISDLKGKVLGVVSLGGAQHTALRYMLRKGGLNPDTDATTIVAGDVPTQLIFGEQCDTGGRAVAANRDCRPGPLQNERTDECPPGISHDSKRSGCHREDAQSTTQGDAGAVESPRQSEPAVS